MAVKMETEKELLPVREFCQRLTIAVGRTHVASGLLFFNEVTLLVRQQEGHSACKKFCLNNPKSYCFEAFEGLSLTGVIGHHHKLYIDKWFHHQRVAPFYAT